MRRPRFRYLATATLRIFVALTIVAFVVVPIGLRLAGRTASLPVSVAVGTAVSSIVLVLCIGLLVVLAVRVAGWRRVLVSAVALVVLASALWTYNTVIWRDYQYRQVTAEFREATPFSQAANLGSPSGWSERIVVPNAVQANLIAGEHLDIATIRYSDEGSARQLFPPADYTNVADVRRRGNTLYILRSITLFRTEYRLTAFDIDHRVLIADRRVDVADVRER